MCGVGDGVYVGATVGVVVDVDGFNYGKPGVGRGECASLVWIAVAPGEVAGEHAVCVLCVFIIPAE